MEMTLDFFLLQCLIQYWNKWFVLPCIKYNIGTLTCWGHEVTEIYPNKHSSHHVQVWVVSSLPFQPYLCLY